MKTIEGEETECANLNRGAGMSAVVDRSCCRVKTNIARNSTMSAHGKLSTARKGDHVSRCRRSQGRLSQSTAVAHAAKMPQN